MTRHYTRFIPGEEIAGAEQWEFGAVDGAALLAAKNASSKAEAQANARDESLRQQGYDEGYALGYTQGQAQATLQGRQQLDDYISKQGKDAAQAFGQLLASARAGLGEVEQNLAQGVLELACDIARQVLRQELAVAEQVVMPVIREALGMLVADAQAAVVRLHPQDLAPLKYTIRAEFPNLAVTLVADATLARGGCLVESAGMVVDGRLDKRWQRAVASLGLNVPWQETGDGA